LLFATFAVSTFAATTTIHVVERISGDWNTPDASGGFGYINPLITNNCNLFFPCRRPSNRADWFGNTFASNNEIYDATNTGDSIGTSSGFSVRTATGNDGRWYRMETLNLANGSISFAGTFTEDRPSTLLVTGGSGAYANAQGSVRLRLRDASNNYDMIFNLDSEALAQVPRTEEVPTVYERETTTFYGDLFPAGDSIGDQMLSSNFIYGSEAVYDPQYIIGYSSTACVRTVVDPINGQWYCTATFASAQDSSTTFVYGGTYFDSGESTYLIKGGTGGYAGLRGSITQQATKDANVYSTKLNAMYFPVTRISKEPILFEQNLVYNERQAGFYINSDTAIGSAYDSTNPNLFQSSNFRGEFGGMSMEGFCIVTSLTQADGLYQCAGTLMDVDGDLVALEGVYGNNQNTQLYAVTGATGYSNFGSFVTDNGNTGTLRSGKVSDVVLNFDDLVSTYISPSDIDQYISSADAQIIPATQSKVTNAVIFNFDFSQIGVQNVQSPSPQPTPLPTDAPVAPSLPTLNPTRTPTANPSKFPTVAISPTPPTNSTPTDAPTGTPAPSTAAPTPNNLFYGARWHMVPTGRNESGIIQYSHSCSYVCAALIRGACIESAFGRANTESAVGIMLQSALGFIPASVVDRTTGSDSTANPKCSLEQSGWTCEYSRYGSTCDATIQGGAEGPFRVCPCSV